VRAQDAEYAMVDLGQRAVGIRTTTRPDDTSTVSGSRRAHEMESGHRGGGEQSTSGREITGRMG
jgi:hypothetical protein